ncbi:MAG: ABC transporter permease [Candidatus Bathyarchaeaceae archaeon]
MSALRRITVIIGYEWRRALAKKSVLALIILAVAVQTLIMTVYSRFIVGTIFLTQEVKPFMWILGVLQGQGLFVQLIAIIIAGSTMSEEYEHGTADILLSKPVTRVEYLSGKFLGGLSLLALVEALTTVVGVILASWFFGPQNNPQYVPLMFLAIVYSTLIFFCLSFMFSEVLRRSTLAMLIALAVLIASSIISQLLAWLYITTSEYLYFYLSRGIPTWSANYFPSLLMRALMNMPSSILFDAINDPLIPTEAAKRGVSEAILVREALQQAAIIVAVYAIIFILVAVYRLLKSDVTKKTA